MGELDDLRRLADEADQRPGAGGLLERMAMARALQGGRGGRAASPRLAAFGPGPPGTPVGVVDRWGDRVTTSDPAALSDPVAPADDAERRRLLATTALGREVLAARDPAPPPRGADWRGASGLTQAELDQILARTPAGKAALADRDARTRADLEARDRQVRSRSEPAMRGRIWGDSGLGR